MKKFNSLADPQYKIVGLIMAIIGLCLFIIQKILNLDYEPGWEDRILMLTHYIIIFGLIMLNYSKEKYDDERIQSVRYSMLKLSYVWTIIGVTLYLVMTSLDSLTMNLYDIIYIIEGILILYQVMFRILLATNPGWVFNETRSRRGFLMMGIGLVLMVILVVYDLITFTI